MEVLVYYLLSVVDIMTWLTGELEGKGYSNRQIVRNTGELWQIVFSKDDHDKSSYPTSSFYNVTLTFDTPLTEE